MLKNKIASVLAVCAVMGVMCLSGCAGETESTSEQSGYSYAVISPRAEVGNSSYAQIDVYYDDVSNDKYAHYDGSPYVAIKNSVTGRVCATAKIPTVMVSEFSVASPESAELNCFDVEGNTILAALIPLSETDSGLYFFHYTGDDLYGMHYCTAMFAVIENDSLDWKSLTVSEGGLADSLGNRFEFDFSDYPTIVSLKTSS